jgi:hypothetical protein
MKRAIFLLVAVLGAFAIGYSFHGCSEKFGTQVDSASWMPPGATDGAFYTGPTAGIIGAPYFHCEFTISESDFRSFMADRGKEIEEIDDPIYVRRYLERFVREEDFKRGRSFDRDAYDAASGITISDGLFWRHEFEDQSYIYAFDRSKSRAYFELNFR